MLLKLFNSKKALNEAAIDYDGLIEITDEMRGRLQKILLEMYDDLKRVCDAYNITLYLGGGSALGAIRYKGFIPWDDDLDINISRKDYEKFKKIFANTELSKKYILNAPNYSEHPKARFPQFIKKGTLFEELVDYEGDKQMQGIKIDIFVIDSVSNHRIVRCLKGLQCDFLEFIASKVQGVKGNNNMYKDLQLHSGKITYYLSYIIGRIFSIVNLRTWFNWIDKCIHEKNSNGHYCTMATGRRHFFGELMPREVYYPAKEVEFCGRKSYVFHDVDTYLTNLYGNYMKEPSLKNRERHFIKNIDFGSKSES